MKRFNLSIFTALVLTLFVVTPVFAGGGHIYGVVFLDEDGNGVWGAEPGVADVAIHFVQGDTDIVLYSAWNDNDDTVGADLYCTHLRDEYFGHSETHWKIPKGCNGAAGLIGDGVESWWKVYIEVPAGYKLTTPGSASNPYYVEALDIGETWVGGKEWIEFGLQPAAAGGQMPTYTGQYAFLNMGIDQRWVADGVLPSTLAGISVIGPYKANVPK